MRNILIIILLASFSISFAQDKEKSLVIKPTKIYIAKPLVAPKNAGYPLLAAYILAQKAKEGDVFAQHELGIRYLLNEGFPADTALAAYWVGKAADQNLPSAKMNYGIMLNNGIGVEWNPFDAYKNFKYAAYHGVRDAQFAYGIFLIDNLVVSRNMTEAYVWIKKAADDGNEIAKDVLKNLEEKGISAPDSVSSKIEGLVKQNSGKSEQDVIMSQDFEFDFINFSEDTTKKNSDEALEKIVSLSADELKKLLGIDKVDDIDTSTANMINFAAENGSPEALHLLARSYEKGVLFEENELLSLVNYIRAYRLGSMKSVSNILEIIKNPGIFERLSAEIDKENSDAMFAWAGLVAMGFDYRLSSEQAFDMLLKAGEKNNIYALVETGLCYFSGTLVQQNRLKANEYWGRAAELGSKEALVRLAFNNLFNEDNYAIQRSNFNIILQAAGEGSVLAQAYIAFCYEQGKGIDKNKAMAAEYYRRASNRGNETAFESLKRMHDEIRPDEEEFKIY